MKQQYKNQKFWILIMAFSVLVGLLAIGYINNKPKPIDLVTYENLLKDKKITKAKIEKNRIVLFTNEGQFDIVKEGVNINELLKQIPVESSNDDDISEYEFMIVVLLVLLIILLPYYYRRKNKQLEQQEQRNQAYELETMMSQKITPTTSSITFKDIAGIESVKEELTEIVDFLKHPSRYKQYGITLPKGVLLVGPPGVGKTMVAKAIAGEANVPFFYQSGASFVQIYVGMGAKRVRELFSKAKAYAPSIIFIDEIDAVGKARGGMRNDERESTLNQLLTEIDGFEDSSGVMVVAATNKVEMIDEALLRSGRFDRRIFLPLPDFKDRMAILKIYLENKPCNVNEEEIAKMTVGFSGAALSTLVNEAAINALRRDSKIVLLEDFMAVRDKVLLGKKKVLSFNEDEKQIQATYQAAKAICAFWFEIEFDKIMILGGGLKDVDREIESKTQMFSKIKVYLSGIAASELIYNESFSNAKEDLFKARDLATLMAENYGMGETLMPSVTDVNMILQNALNEVKEFLEGMQKPLQNVKQRLLESESISKDEIKEIINNSF